MTSSTPDNVIRVDILDFELERGYDFMIVGNGDESTDKNSRITDKLTGKIKLKRLVSSGSKLWIEFHTDRTGLSRGFDILLTTADSSSKNCK